ncbi:Protein kinase-like domain [Pseudocohnilembus persalinus]|uniref:non-specific serine/threonine protein kinase n=1 Tax=Pseudocohnilembus persalinus TaxID=266149 RepID=A0A0V0QCI8_PSEPJ|nr:Protein kinase-like domain [Pseudocohnilembus persalinus]|eukprot:KRW99866.1 Protein kinase-like domain [Pseudocohnilembus persalinus]
MEDTIGTGSFGKVVKAIHKETNQVRAVKVINRERNHIDTLEKILQEVNVLKNLDHPNILKIYECFQDKNNYYIVSEYCQGGELFETISKKLALSEKEASQITAQLISAISYMHSKGFIHRDIKPENILFLFDTENSPIKLIDFGSSIKKQNNIAYRTGTCYYIAPEILQRNYNQQCDLWSIGVVTYIMLSGYPPFNDQDEQQIFEKILNCDYNFKENIWENISQDAKKFISNMLKLDPKQRYTPQQALQDPWIKKFNSNLVSSIQENQLQQSFKNLIQFNEFEAFMKEFQRKDSQIQFNDMIEQKQDINLLYNIEQNPILEKPTMQINTQFDIYKAPEFYQNNQLSAENDMFSLGVMLYLIVTGKKPFENQEKLQKNEEINLETIEFALYSQNFKKFLKNLLTKNPQKRLNVNQALNDEWIKQMINFKQKLPNLDKTLNKYQLFQQKQEFVVQIQLFLIYDSLLDENLQEISNFLQKLDPDGQKTVNYNEFINGLKDKLDQIEYRQEIQNIQLMMQEQQQNKIQNENNSTQNSNSNRTSLENQNNLSESQVTQKINQSNEKTENNIENTQNIENIQQQQQTQINQFQNDLNNEDLNMESTQNGQNLIQQENIENNENISEDSIQSESSSDYDQANENDAENSDEDQDLQKLSKKNDEKKQFYSPGRSPSILMKYKLQTIEEEEDQMNISYNQRKKL